VAKASGALRRAEGSLSMRTEICHTHTRDQASMRKKTKSGGGEEEQGWTKNVRATTATERCEGDHGVKTLMMYRSKQRNDGRHDHEDAAAAEQEELAARPLHFNGSHRRQPLRPQRLQRARATESNAAHGTDVTRSRRTPLYAHSLSPSHREIIDEQETPTWPVLDRNGPSVESLTSHPLSLVTRMPPSTSVITRTRSSVATMRSARSESIFLITHLACSYKDTATAVYKMDDDRRI